MPNFEVTLILKVFPLRKNKIESAVHFRKYAVINKTRIKLYDSSRVER